MSLLPRVNRRQFLQVGGIGTFGLTLPTLLQTEATARAAGKSQRAKSCIFLYLYGGPSQIDTWDMKPDAPADYRGEFKPIPTSVPGTRIVEHLPKMAKLAEHYSIIRTLHHKNRNHQPAGSYLLTCVEPPSDNAAQVKPMPDDPPALGALATRLAPPKKAGVPPFIMMPAKLHDQGSFFRGQTGGWLGGGYDPLVINQDPNAKSFKIDGFSSAGLDFLDRLGKRRDLLAALDRDLLPGNARSMSEYQQRALDLIGSTQGQSAFDLSSVSDKERDRYGRNMFGQGCLLARRLVESGARLVQVSDCTTAGHHEWDTHGNNFGGLKSRLLPKLDQAYSALLQDLLDRGLLEDTVVYVGGEFGRTPKIGQNLGTGVSANGRDHYPSCFCGLLAGGHVRPGIIHGQSDAKAAFPQKDPVTLPDLAATLFAAMGINPEGVVTTKENRPVPITHGKPVAGLLG